MRHGNMSDLLVAGHLDGNDLREYFDKDLDEKPDGILVKVLMRILMEYWRRC